eukprot:CAMPEP_0170231608 /NCGR_PEP_ID=MMETSP0116_2-20130129/15539_1 /TAXON_ID=400756 /ORGANISM="Durinskia baltica, Strain CSIRO CS-38" /LENGTH=495 /DNA_ID=CAMNT_0010482381 /DNA_START=60 /DNA_END=1547 /DNA_ORIENTATION=-
MATAVRRLNTAASDMSVNSRLSDRRREKLLSIKQREDLKGALTEKFKGRFGHGAPLRAVDEMSVASATIRDEVDKFAGAGPTEANLGRLERRLQAKARPSDDNASEVSGYSSAPSHLSRTRSAPSIAGSGIIGNQPGKPQYNWSKLDQYASYLHEQDCIRQHLGHKALQKKLRSALDHQVAQKQNRKAIESEEEQVYHQNTLLELERWKEAEKSRDEERKQKALREKAERDAQLEYERKLKADELDKKKSEEAQLVNKIVEEMESEQKRLEKKKLNQIKSMRKVFEENAADQAKKNEDKRRAMEQEAAQLKEYARALDEQEEKRNKEMQDRIDRQAALMKKLQENVDGLKKGAGDNDAARAAAQQEEMDRHFFEAEQMKQNRLRELRHENQAYLLRQMEEKDMRRSEEKELQNIQAMILHRDAEEYNEVERQKLISRRQLLSEHAKDIKKQVAYKLSQSVPIMTEAEIAMNKPLLQLVDRTLHPVGEAETPVRDD